MRTLLLSRITLVWVLLVAATLLAFNIGHGAGLGNPQHAGIAILVLAFVKVRLVILDFMELRHAPIFMRMIGEVWVVLIAVVLITMFLLSPPHAAAASLH